MFLCSHEQLGGNRHRGGGVLGLIRVRVLPSEHAKEAHHKEPGGVCAKEYFMNDHGF